VSLGQRAWTRRLALSRTCLTMLSTPVPSDRKRQSQSGSDRKPQSQSGSERKQQLLAPCQSPVAAVPTPSRNRVEIVEKQAEIERMQKTLNDLSQHMGRMHGGLEDANELRQQLQNAEEEASQRSRECWQVRAQVRERDEVLVTERKTAEQLRAQLCALQDELARQRLHHSNEVQVEQQTTEELRKLIKELEEKLEASASKTQDCDRVTANLENQLAESRAAEVEANAKALELKDHAQNLQQELVGSQLAHSTAEAKASEAESHAEKLQCKHEELENEHSELRTSVSQSESTSAAQLRAAEAREEELQQSLVNATSQVKSLDAELASVKSAAEASDAELSQRALLLADELAKNKEMAVKVERLEHELAQSNFAAAAASQQCSSDSAARVRKSEGELLVAQSKATAAESRTSAAESQKAHAEEELAEIQEQVKAADACVSDAIARSEQAMAHADSLQQELEDAAGKAAGAETRAESLQQELVCLQQELTCLQQEKAQASKGSLQQAAAGRALEASKKKLAEESKRADRLQQELAGLKSSRGAAQARSAKAEKEVKTTQMRVEELEQEWGQQKAKAAAQEDSPVIEANRVNPSKPAMQTESPVEPFGPGGMCRHYNIGGDEEDLRLQNRELSLTVLQFQQDCEGLEGENQSLKRALTVFEESLEQHAVNIGHTNHKQKIRYTVQLKDQINQLLSDLTRCRKQIVKLQANRNQENLLDALESLGMLSGLPNNARSTSAPQSPQSPDFSRPTVSTSARQNRRASLPTPARPAAIDESAGILEARLEETEMRCERQKKVFDIICTDFLHLKALVERVVQVTDGAEHIDGGSFADLLDRLRHALIKANSHSA